MASIATDVKWGSSPTNYFNFSYSKQRSGTTQQYKITVECEPCTGASYFGYPIYLEITVNGSKAATTTLKSASPSQWSSAITYTTGWINVPNKTTGTTPIKIRIYSGSGSTRDTSYSYSLAVDPAESKIAATNANIGSQSTVTFTRYNSAFTHTLSYKATGQSSYTTIFSKQNITSYAWTVPVSLCTLITSGTTISVTLQCQTYSGSTLVGTTTCTMTATATPSKIGATDANIGSKSTVTFTRYNNAFTHTLAYKAAGQSSYTTIFSKQNITSHPWEIPTSLYALIPAAKTIKITLQCQTYSGSTLIGTTYDEITATAAESECAPTITVTAIDTNPYTVVLTGTNNAIIRYHSDVEVTATATAKNEASITKTILKCGSKTVTDTQQGKEVVASYTFTGAESAEISATTKDGREYPAEYEVPGLFFVKYITLTANTTATRDTPTGDKVTITTTGNFFNGNFGKVQNSLKAEVRYKPQSQAEYTDNDLYTTMTVTINGNTYEATAELTGLDYQKAYDIRVRVQDAIYKYNGPIKDARYSHTTLSKGVPVFDWGENDFRFNVPLYSGGLNFTYVYQAEDGAAGLAQGDTFTPLNPTPKHRLYYIRPTISDGINPANIYIPCTRLGNMLIGAGGFPHASGRIDFFTVYVTFNNDETATVTYCGYWNTETQLYAQRSINGIFAVL